MSTAQQRSNYVVVSTPHTREAKKVIDYKIYNGKRYYKVKWESSWEPEDSLTEYQDLVDQFWDFVKRVSTEDKDEQGRKRQRLQSDDDAQDDNDASIGNSEDDIPVKGTITLSEGVKLQESGNFYRLTQDKEETEHDDSTIFIVQGNQPTHILKNRAHKGNVHVIGLQHEPKTTLTTVKKQIRVPDDSAENLVVLKLTETDKAFGWNNPFVRTAFFCRVCKLEQGCEENLWKEHFKTHVVQTKGKPLEEVPPQDSIKKKDSTVAVCSDPNIPLIQKVDHLVQNWGISQYVRMAFLCRYCGKEQQTNHTGNWRNHYQLSHRPDNSIVCDVCQLSVRNKPELRKHKKNCHESPQVGKEAPLHTCQICSMPFRKKADVKKHVAEKHNIKADIAPVRKESANIDNAEDETFVRDKQPKAKLKVKMFPDKSSADSAATKKAQKQSKKAQQSQKAQQSPSNRNFICGMCYENFKTKVDMKNHQNMVHFHKHVSTATTSYNCPKCHKSFEKHKDLTNHTIDHHGIEDAVPGATMVPREERPPENTLMNVVDSSKLSNVMDSDSDGDDLVLVIKEEEEEDIPADERPAMN